MVNITRWSGLEGEKCHIQFNAYLSTQKTKKKTTEVTLIYNDVDCSLPYMLEKVCFTIQ